MKVNRKDSGERYTPFDHFNMTTRVIFNPQTGSKHANCTLSTLGPNSGSNDEVHPNSDQIFYVLTGTLCVSAKGVLLHTVHAGDAVLVEAGDVHAVRNGGEGDCNLVVITAPPLEQTH
jgi:quercetin dioxygenase-like cupin family protein